MNPHVHTILQASGTTRAIEWVKKVTDEEAKAAYEQAKVRAFMDRWNAEIDDDVAGAKKALIGAMQKGLT